MDLDTFEKTVRLVHDEYDAVRFIWHGGEPLLASEEFLKKAISIEKKYFGKNLERCGNTIQTNGTLLRSKFIEFCKDSRINIGLSFEGDYGNGLRIGADNNAIADVVRYMVKKGHMFSISATIHNGNVDNMLDIFNQFNSMKASFCYNPVLNIGGCLDDGHISLDSDEYVRNCINVFDTWAKDANASIPLMPFYQYVLTALSEPNISDCAHSSCLTKWVCVYPNGDVYPCGKACPDEFKMGNIHDMNHLSEAFESDGFRNILLGSIERRDACSNCEIFRYCNGGCSIDALADGNIASSGGFSCIVYKAIFKHIKDFMDGILENKPDLSLYNRYIRDAVVGKLINPRVYDSIAPIQ